MTTLTRWSGHTAAAVLALTLPLTAAAQETTLRAVLSSDLRSLMPGGSTDIASGAIRQNIYEGLVAPRADGSVAMMLADKVDVADEGRRYTFTLRDGVRFHNGAPLTAKEVVWTWERFLDPAAAWPCRQAFSGANIAVKSVTAPDDRTVVFELAQPTTVFLRALARTDCDATPVAHPDSVDEKGTWVRAIGTGPFMLSNFKPGELVELKKYPDYASLTTESDGIAGAKEARVDRVLLRLITDASVAKAAIQAGDVDVWMDAQPNMLEELRADKRVQVDMGLISGAYTLPMQTQDPLLSDVRIRRAINLAIDREALVQALTDGTAAASTSLVPVTSRYYSDVQKQGPRYDPEAARKLLAEAGYRGQPLVILTNKQYAVMAETAIAVQAMLAAVGINASVDTVEYGTQHQRYFAGKYQMTVWNVTPYLDPVFSFERFIGDKSKQPDRPWDTPKARELLAKLFVADDGAESQAIFDELHQAFVDDAPIAIWGLRSSVGITRPNVEGYQVWPGQKARFWNVSIK